MKVVILAGGGGTRLSEETDKIPKPMVEIGGKPIIWHIMRHYAHHGFKEFVIALGYKGEVIKQHFLQFHQLSGDIRLELETGVTEVNHTKTDDWIVHLVDTGADTMTGGRLKRLEELLSDGPFMLTYGDGVSPIDIKDLVAFHRKQGCLATVTAVRPPARFGGIVFDGDLVADFTEKPQIGEGWINGGFMVMETGVFDILKSDEDVLEVDLMEKLVEDRELAAYRHEGFWQCMDTLRDKKKLEQMWQSGNAPWKTWE